MLGEEEFYFDGARDMLRCSHRNLDVAGRNLCTSKMYMRVGQVELLSGQPDASCRGITDTLYHDMFHLVSLFHAHEIEA